MAKRKSRYDYCYIFRATPIVTMDFTYDRIENVVICAFYIEYGDCTEDVALFLETFSFKLKGLFYSEKVNLCFSALFKSRVSSFNPMLIVVYT